MYIIKTGENMKKIIIGLFAIALLTGCFLDKTPKNSVVEFFDKYQDLDEDVLEDLEFASESRSFTNSKMRETYVSLMKMQYSDLKYEINDITVNADKAKVTVTITVYDFYKAGRDADTYYLNHSDEFESTEKFMMFKLNEMMKTSDRIEYTLVLDLSKIDDKWKVETLSDEELEKIHGTYNYERD